MPVTAKKEFDLDAAMKTPESRAAAKDELAARIAELDATAEKHQAEADAARVASDKLRNLRGTIPT